MKPKKEFVTSEQTEEVFLKMMSLFKRKCEICELLPNKTLKLTLEKAYDELKLDKVYCGIKLRLK